MFTSFLKPITNLAFQHPGVAIAGAFASVAAPAFLKDENRGYLRTALVTTPVVAALAFAGPGLVASASRTTKGGLRFVREMPFFFGKNLAINYKDLRNFVESGNIDLAAINPALHNLSGEGAVDFFSQVDRGAPPIEYSMDRSMEIFNRLMPDEGKRTLLTYATEGARLRAASPLQLSTNISTLPMAAMAESDLRGIVNANKADPRFIKEFSTRLRWAERLEDTGVSLSPLPVASSTFSLNLSEHMGILAKERPEVANALQSAITKKAVDSATLIAEKTTSGEIGRLLGINLTGPNNTKLQLPIFDPSTGLVRGGQDFQELGIGRRLYDQHGYEDLDVFVAQNLTGNWQILKEDIKRAAVYGGVDPSDYWKVSTHPDSQEALLSPLGIHLSSHKAIPTGLGQFAGGKTWAELSPAERVEQYKELMIRRNMVAMGSESGLIKGNMEMRELTDFVVGGVIPTGRQSPFYQSFSKPMQLNISDMAESWKPYVTTAAAEAIGGVPEVRVTVAGVSAQQRALFGDLPANITDLPGYSETAIQRIINDTGLSHSKATAVWEKMSGKLTAREGFYDAARRLGGLGEGSILLHEKFSSLNMEMVSPVKVDQLRINVNEAMKKPFGPNELIGFSGLGPVTSNAPQTYIEKVNALTDKAGANYFELQLRKVYNLMAGSKIQVGGVKGLVSGMSPDDEFSRIRELLNMYGEATGGDIIPDIVDAFAPLEHTSGKVHDPFNVLLQQAFEVSNQVVKGQTTTSQAIIKEGYDTKALTAVNNYMADLAAYGIKSSGERLVDDLSTIPQSERLTRIRNITNRTTSFYEELTPLIKHGHTGTTQSSLFSAFRESKTTNLMEYMQKRASPMSMAAWHTTEVDVPQITNITSDIFSEMFRLGHVEGMRDIMGRLEFQGGDPAKAAAFAHHFVGQDFTKPLPGGNVIPVEQAIPTFNPNLNSMESRIGGVFDPTNPAVQENYSIGFKEPVYTRFMGKDIEVSYLPSLGMTAQGGGTNLYEAGEGLAYYATDVEKAKALVVKHQQSPTKLANAVTDYLTEVNRAIWGKSGFYRPKSADPMGSISGFLEARALPNEPFTAVIPEQMARKIRDDKIRRALGMEADVALGHEVLRHPGMEVYATAFRHPVQSAPYMNVRVDTGARLGPNEIALDPSTHAFFGADVDRDPFNLTFHTPGSAAEAEAKAAISDLNSSQHKSLEIHDMLYGSSEDFRKTIGSDIKSMSQLIEKELGSNPIDAVLHRAAGGEGAYSNLLTNLYQNIEMHPTIGVNQEARSLLGHMLWPLRQVPISAKKGQMEMNVADPLEIVRDIRVGMAARSEEGAAQITVGLSKVYKGFNKGSILNERTAKYYTELTGKPGVAGQVVENALMDALYSDNFQKTLKDYTINRNLAADAAATLITKDVSEVTADSMFSMHQAYKQMKTAIPYQQGIAKEGRSGKYISRVLGDINDSIKGAAKEIGQNKGARVLAIGLGVAAGASILSARIKSPTPASAVFSSGTGNFRPEDRTNVSDHVPGEVMAGQMSSVNPPRRQLATRKGSTSAIVAPMHQRSDLEVSMQAQDRKDTAEVQRIVGQMGGNQGVSNININYRNSWRSKMSRMRQREIIREDLES